MSNCALNSQQGRLCPLVQLSSDWYWETDATHRLRKLQQSTRYRTGLEEGPAEKGWWELHGSDAADAQWLSRHLAQQQHRAFHEIEVTLSDAQGRIRHALVSGQPMLGKAGRFGGYRGVGHDITAQKEAEHGLNASESQLAAIIDATTDAIITVDAQGRIVVFNSSASQMFGCTRAQALGAPVAQYVPDVMELIPGRAECEEPMRNAPLVLARALETVAHRGPGERFSVEASVSRIELNGAVLFCIVLRDLTQRLAAERARRTLEAQLRESQKMEALGTLAGGIAHDFNNIIAAILGNAALAQDNIEKPALARSFVAEIGKAGLRARDIVQRIMAFSRKQPAVFSCQPLKPLIEEGVQLLRAMLPSGIEVVPELAAEPLYVQADGSQIGQVLMNLGTNAWQALGSRPGRITVALACVDDHAQLSVSDDGCGMDEATLECIFQPFFTTKALGQGTGLGLSVVHGIVVSHGGRIEVTSRKNQGTRFDIFLPLAAPPEAAAPSETPSRCAPITGQGQHVLYLDDYPAIVFMMTATLQASGYRVSGFEDASKALAYLREHAAEVDLVVTDQNMPGQSGLELAGEVRRLRPDLPIVLASGYITDELRRQAAEVGVAHLFDKPRGIDEMCVLVGEILRAQGAAEAGEP